VDVIATASPSSQPSDATSKVVLANVQVLTAGTRMEPDQEKGKAMPVTVVTLLVSPEQAERLALASTEGKIQLALRNPMDQGAPATPGVKPAGLLGVTSTTVRASVAGRSVHPKASVRVAEVLPPAPPPAPTVEIIRGDKRATEIIK
jgi:pilus assembly protein CpaB